MSVFPSGPCKEAWHGESDVFSSQNLSGWHGNGGILQFGVGAAALLAAADNP